MTDTAEVLHNSVDFDETMLADASIGGDHGAFEMLYAHYFARVRNFCIRKLGDRELAEDVAQEAFARAYERIGTFGGAKNFGGWVSTIAANLCTDHLRRRKFTPMSLEQIEHTPSYDVNPIHNLQRQDNSRLVRSALEKLEPRHREALMLHEVGGLSCAAVGTRLGISEVAAESLLARARRRLRKEISSKAVPADLFGVGGIVFLPGLVRSWQRARSAVSRRGIAMHSAAARLWETVGAAVPALQDGKAFLAAVGAGVVIGVASGGGDAQHVVNRPAPVVAPAPSGASTSPTTGPSGVSVGPVRAGVQVAPDAGAVGGGATVGVPGAPTGSDTGLDLGAAIGLNGRSADPAAKLVLQGIDGRHSLDTSDVQLPR